MYTVCVIRKKYMLGSKGNIKKLNAINDKENVKLKARNAFSAFILPLFKTYIAKAAMLIV